MANRRVHSGSVMTTYGPYKRLVVRTNDAIITIIGINMMATVTGYDGSTAPQAGFSISEASHAGLDVGTTERDDSLELGSPRIGESSSTVDHQLSASSDMESVSVSEEIQAMVCDSQTTDSSSGQSSGIGLATDECTSAGDSELEQGIDMESVSVSEKVVCQSRPSVIMKNVDSDLDQPSDIISATDECGSLDHSESEQDGANPSSPISSDNESITGSDSGSDNRGGECKTTVALSPSSKKRCNLEDCDGEETEQSVVIDKCSNVSREATNILVATDSRSSNSGLQLQLQSTRRKHPLKKKTHSHGKKPYSCDACGKTFAQSWRLSQHACVHTGERSYSCDTCGKTFSQRGNLSKHIRVHTGERPYSCDTCGKTFSQSGSLSRHILVHTGERPYSCDTCGKTFSQSGDLSQHVRIHTGERPYSCDTCGKTFSQRGSLSQHVLVHTGERPYSCDTCGKTFSQSGSLSRHILIHTGERPYSCDTCGKVFARSGDLSQHVRVHTGERQYFCDTCGKMFARSNTLSRHIRVHTGEKPYSCDTCGKRFALAETLSGHIRVHTGERPYSCDTCGKTFTRSGHLSKHVRAFAH